MALHDEVQLNKKTMLSLGYFGALVIFSASVYLFNAANPREALSFAGLWFASGTALWLLVAYLNE